MELDIQLQSKLAVVIEDCYQKGYNDAILKAHEWLICHLNKNTDIEYGILGVSEDSVKITSEGIANFYKFMEME